MIETTGGAAMKRCVIHWVVMSLILGLYSCSQDKSGQDLVLAQINDYALTLNEFNTQLKEELEYDKDFKLNHDARKRFLDQIITKELLIQEAKRRELDREDKFIRAIERYWEATLIRDLMALEGQAIEKRTVVSQEEIEARYGAMLKSDPNQPPLASLQDQIAQEIINERKQRSLEEWIGRLKTQAQISVNERLITKE